jgi:SpoVK/Ycf46/Vps4 family AAA+-type ATPase
VRRASDLLSPFVGVAEKQIAAAFREAEESGAVLLIDEVDSFLQDRSRAQRGWEVTQVNEFLTQMENFPGIFVASSNLIDGFDSAALRRFDLKAKFDYLRPDQAVALLQAHLANAGLPPSAAEVDARLRRLLALAPGDFAAVARQHRFRPLRTPEDWVAALEAECRHKPGARNRPAIGFGGAAA